jgi:hypothetical protein
MEAIWLELCNIQSTSCCCCCKQSIISKCIIKFWISKSYHWLAESLKLHVLSRPCTRAVLSLISYCLTSGQRDLNPWTQTLDSQPLRSTLGLINPLIEIRDPKVQSVMWVRPYLSE